jgi:hypothetical protein
MIRGGRDSLGNLGSDFFLPLIIIIAKEICGLIWQLRRRYLLPLLLLLITCSVYPHGLVLLLRRLPSTH